MRQTKPTRKASSTLLAFIVLASLTIAPLPRMAKAAETKPTAIPLGHPDFYPSDDRPIGWRGDRTGAWPGANCVPHWDAKTGPSSSREGGTAPRQGENIVWAAKTPGAGFCQPIVVGEKVFITADPNLLVCYNVHDGSILWQTAIDHTAMMEPELQKAARAERAFLDAKWREYSEFCDGVETLYNMVTDAGLKPDVMFQRSSHTSPLVEPVDDGKASDLLKNTGIKALWAKLYAKQEEIQMYVQSSDSGSNIRGGTELARRVQEAQQKYSLWFGGGWEGWGTWSFRTPCSDGKRIYVTTVNNAVAAVNLDGTIAWQVWDHLGGEDGLRRTSSGIGTRNHGSPQLYRDWLVVYQDSHMRVYDKHTGKKIWEHAGMYEARWQAFPRTKYPEMNERYAGLPKAAAGADWTAILTAYRKEGKGMMHGSRPVPEGASLVVLEIPLPDGTIMPAVYDGGCFLYRLEDGKVLSADVPFASQSSPVAAGNLLMQSCEQTYVVRLTAKDRDTVEFNYIYKNLGNDPNNRKNFSAQGSGTTIYHDGWWYTGNGVRMSVEDARMEPFGMRCGGSNSPILAGDRIYAFNAGRLYKNRLSTMRTLDGVGTAQDVDLRTGLVTSIEVALIDRRFEDADSEYTRRNKWVDVAYFVSLASPSAQANRLFFRTKGILYCYGDPGEAFPKPKECPSVATAPAPAFETEAAAMAIEKDPAKLTAGLSHAHPRVRREAALRLASLSTTDQLPPTTLEHLQRLARGDTSVAVRAEAFRALGLQPDQPGRVLLSELMGSEAGFWQRPDPIFGSLLEKLGIAVEPVALALLGKGTPQQKENVAAAVIYRFIPRSDALRDALIPMLTQRKSDGLMARCLLVWANDPAVTAAFATAINDSRFSYDQPAMFEYLLPLQKGGERRTFLKNVAGFNGVQNARGAAIQALVADGAVAEIRSLMAAATGRMPSEIAQGLSQACAQHNDVAVRAAAVDIIAKHLNQEDKYCQMNMVNVLGQFGADAAPALPAIKAINPGEDKGLAESRNKTIAAIEKAMKEKK